MQNTSLTDTPTGSSMILSRLLRSFASSYVMRIQVFFHNDDTWVVVPCGDGNITISQLINRATARFKKITNTHLDEVLHVGSICLHHKGTYVDKDDEVADILENNEAVVLQQTSWIACTGKSTSEVITHGASQDTKVLSERRRAHSVQSVDSGFIASQSSRTSQEGTSYGQHSLTANLQLQPSPYHNVNLSVGSQTPSVSPLLGVAARSLHPLQRVKQDSGIWDEHHHRLESALSINEDNDTDTDVEKENLDSSKKNSMLPSGSGNKNGVQENLDVTSQSESSRTPSPLPAKDIDDSEQSTDQEEGENAKYGEIHIIELKKEKEPLGIHLVDGCTSTLLEDAPGVFIGAMDENGFAFKSGKLHYNDRILACNGVDFTRKDLSEPVKDIFYRMAKEPLLRIAIGRGIHIPITTDNEGTNEEVDENVSSSGEATPTTPMNTSKQTVKVNGNASSRDHAVHEDEVTFGEDIPSVVFHLGHEESDAAPTDSHSSPMPQILVSQQMPPSQQSNLTSTLEQEQLSPENRSEKLSTEDSSSKSLKLTKGKETSAAEIVVPQLKPMISPGEATWDLRCVEVCGETSVVVRHNAWQFAWEGFGLKLHIYEGCLPADMEQCVILIKASLAGLYEFPENTCPVSAVFWLCCVPECKFARSIGLEIQHCGKLEGDSRRLSFARAVCCQKQLPYTFKDIGGDFTNHSFYGFIELKGFSGLAVVQEGSEERYYLASLLYKEISSHRSRCIVEIYIALTWNVDVHHSILITRFKDAFMETQQPIEFESDQVEFKISNISHEKWDIKCLNSPVVKKADVDRFTPGKTSWVPSSKFKAKFSDDLTLVCDLECDVDVIGAMQPHNKFVIDICPQAGSSQLFQYPPPAQPATGIITSTRLTDLNYTTLLQQLRIHAAKWREIGTHLGFKPGELDNIHSNALHLSVDLPVSCLNEMLNRWLQWAPGDNRGSNSFATLEALKAALTQAGLGAAAHDLHV